MILIELIYNLALLIAMSVVSGFIDTRWQRNTRAGVLLQGVLFGGAAGIGMLRPFVFAPGLVFDGRSVMISLGGLFFGPWTAAVACLMTIPLRWFQGGPGTMMGVLVILSSAAIGVVFHRRGPRPSREIPGVTLLGFGVVVHLAMLTMTTALPPDLILLVLKRIGWPVMLAYPLATVLIGKILSDQATRHGLLASLRESEGRYRELVEHANSVILRMKPDGTITFFNEFAQRFFGFTPAEILGRNVVGSIVPATDSGGNNLTALLRDLGTHPDRYASNENENVRKDGTRRWLAWTNQGILDDRGHCVAVLCVGVDITQRKQAEEAQRKQEAQHRAMVANIADVIAVIDRDGINRYKSPNLEKWFGWRPEEVVGVSTWENVHPEDLERTQKFFGALLAQPNATGTGECRYRCRDGRYKWIEFSAVNLLHDPDIHGVLLNYHDLTERKGAAAEKTKLEAQVQQAQKMEFVGRLAGGVAHDFNNMLQAILGNVGLALEETPSSSPARANLEEIQHCARRSADLTRQLLAFARRQTVAPRLLDLNETVASLLKLLRRLIGEDIHLAWQPAADLGPVMMDPTQLDQILANLCVNARDAIGGVGRITIETGSAVFDAAGCADHPGLVPGEYVKLAVSDNGCGMDQDTQAHIFEPFFTTKSAGEGTGLGLATVYGIVKQNHGFIYVLSKPGEGATFKIYLPRHGGRASVDPTECARQLPECHGETVLLVEDEVAILAIARKVLERLGYTVLSASTPDEAIGLAETPGREIHLLMTDVVMPGMNGRDLARRLGSLHPKLKCLFMSGYTSDVIAHHGVLDEGVYFIQKPFSMEDLATEVRQALGDRRQE